METPPGAGPTSDQGTIDASAHLPTGPETGGLSATAVTTEQAPQTPEQQRLEEITRDRRQIRTFMRTEAALTPDEQTELAKLFTTYEERTGFSEAEIRDMRRTSDDITREYERRRKGRGNGSGATFRAEMWLADMNDEERAAQATYATTGKPPIPPDPQA